MSENPYDDYRSKDDEWAAAAQAEAAQIRADREERRLAAAVDAPAEGPIYIVTRTIVSTMQGGPHTPVESVYSRGRSLPRAMAAMAQAAEDMDDRAPWVRTLAVQLIIS